MEKRKILALMSGGVDSSTAAALLVEKGYAVAGVYLKLWEAIGGGPSSDAAEDRPPNIGDPCWAIEMRDAARVAAKLGIPFEVWDVTEDYKKRVLENFYSEYAAGRTPNPDVLCNSEIKFGVGIERALKTGYEYVATGHYARIEEMQNAECRMQNRLRPTSYVLRTALDLNKDQSYFLWRLTQAQLAHVMFPIGEYTKPQVRKLANKFGLHNAQKKDSQGVCFLGKIDLKEFLNSRHLEPSEGSRDSKDGRDSSASPQNDIVSVVGPIVDVDGKVLGEHDGLAHFTIGQRHGTKLGGTGPYFVVEKDMATNTLIVANEQDEPEYRTVECRIKNAECRTKNKSIRCMARVRYRASLTPVTIDFQTSKFGSVRVVFDKPERAVAPGQSIVFYDRERVIGGGIIDSTTLLCKVTKYATVS